MCMTRIYSLFWILIADLWYRLTINSMLHNKPTCQLRYIPIDLRPRTLSLKLTYILTYLSNGMLFLKPRYNLTLPILLKSNYWLYNKKIYLSFKKNELIIPSQFVSHLNVHTFVCKYLFKIWTKFNQIKCKLWTL